MGKRKASWTNSIAYWRKLKGLSQEKLGELLPGDGASKGTISGIESGSSKPSLERLNEIAQALDVPLAALLAPPPVADVIDLWERIPNEDHGKAIQALKIFVK